MPRLRHAARELLEPLLRGEREPDRRELVVVDRDGVVEEDHDAVAREVLERAAVGRDQLADRLVVRAQHLEQLLRRGRLGERREAAEIGEQAGDVRAVAREQLLALLRGDERGHLRREEAGQLGPLPLHGVEQPRVGDRDGRLVGERRDELDLPVDERPRDAPADADDADECVVQEDRNAEQRPIPDDPLRAERVVGVGQDVGDLHRLPGQRRPSDDGRPVTPMRMFDRVVVALGGIEDLRDDHEDVALCEVQLGVVPVAQAPGRRDDRIEHGLEPLRARHRTEDLPHRPLLLAQVLVLPNELLGRRAARGLPSGGL